MAARYFIGTGNRNWNDTANWSATSGGVGGASVPTMDDDVIFDSNSGTGTVTVNAIANMRDCTFAQTQLITLANAAYAFNIFGNWTLCSNTYLATSFTGTGYVYLKATTSVNITSNGCTMAWNRLYFDGVGGTWTNQDDWNTMMTAIYCANGEWVTNDKTFTTYYGIIAATGTKIITFGNSIINTGIVDLTNGVTTVRPNTATLNVNGRFNGIGATWHNINLVGSSTCNLAGNNTIYNLTRNSGTSLVASITLYNNQTVINNLTLTGSNASNYRLLIASNIIGTPRTITYNGTVTASNVDFRDIVGAGTANWDLSAIAGGSGDCGGNSGITFTPAQTQYFKHTSGAVNWSDATKWFSNYERTIAGRVPLPQDDAIFDENSFESSSILNIDSGRISGIDMSCVNVPLKVHLIGYFEMYGSKLYANENVSFPYYSDYCGVILYSRLNLKCINPLPWNIYLAQSKGYVLFECDTVLKFFGVNGNYGKIGFDFNDFDIELDRLSIRRPFNDIKLGNGTITVGSWESYMGQDIEAEGSTVIITDSYSGTMDQTHLNKVIILGDVYIQATQSNVYGRATFNELEVRGSLTLTPNMSNGARDYVIGKLIANGSNDSLINIKSNENGSKALIYITDPEPSTVEYCKFQDIKVSEARKLIAKNSIDLGNNQNIFFDGMMPLVHGLGQVDKMYVGGSEVVSAYYGEVKIK